MFGSFKVFSTTLAIINTVETKLKTSFVIVLIVLINTVLHAADICKTIDENGQVQYSSCAPGEKTHAIKIKPRPAPDQMLEQRRENQRKLLESLTEDQRQKEAQQAKTRNKKNKLKRKCNIARDKLKDYQRSARLYATNSEGHRVFLSDEQKQQQEDSLKKAIKKHCK